MTVFDSGSPSTVDLFQNSFYIGVNLENILYGVELFLYFKTMRILLTSKNARKISNTFYAVFSTVMLFLVTIRVVGQALFGEKMWILDASYPGGPEEYYKKNISVWYVDWGTTALVLLQLMTDGLMIYRCWIIWNSYRVIVLPVILWLGCLALGIVVDWTVSSPGGDFSSSASQLGFAYYTVAVLLNTALTCIICYRILRHARKVREQLGSGYASLYLSIAALLIESACPYTLSGIALLLFLTIESPTSVVFISVNFLMMCISPQMLILRVIMGRAVNNETFMQPHSTLRFNVPDTGVGTTTQPGFEANGPTAHLQAPPNVYHGDGQV